MGLLNALGLKPKKPALVAAAADGSGGPAPGSPQAPPLTAAKASGTPTVSTAQASSPAAIAEMAAYRVARGAVHLLVIALNGHAQAGKVMTQIGQATAKLVQADTHAGKAEFADAMRLVEEARVICVAAKKLADDWAAYAKKRASVRAMIKSYEGFDSPANILANNNAVAAADVLAGQTPPNFAGANAALDAIDTNLRPGVKQGLDDAKALIVKLEAMDAKVKTFAAADIAKGKSLVAQSETAFAAAEWSLCIMHFLAATDVLTTTDRMAERRGRFETQRTTTAAALASVKAKPELKERALEIEAMVAQADALAGPKSMKIDEGITLLETANERCKTWLPIAPTIASYNTGRSAADKELAALDAHAAKDKIVEAREAARKLLHSAASMAALAAGGNNPAQGWSAALTTVTQARADLTEAKKLADSLGPALAAEAAAAKPGDAAGMKTALTALQADAATAAKAPFAAEADAEFKRFKAAAEKADAALTKKDAKAAAKALAEAGQALVGAKAIQVEHGQFSSTLATVEAQLKKLQALPGAAAIKAKIDAVVKAVADAKAKDKAHAGAEAMAALRRAVDAVAAAERADRDRIDYDKAATATTALVGALTDAKIKAKLTKSVAAAKTLAGAFRFAEANKALKQVEVRVDETRLKATISANPADPEIAKIAAKMAAAGGEKLVDAMLQAQADPAVIAALAKGRFGVAFAIDPTATAAQEAKSMKALCKVFAKVSKDMVKNTSIKGVTHEDADDASGAYSPKTAVISMTGRPKVYKQQFGSKLKKKDASGKFVSQLPGKIDPACKPKNEDPVEALSFAAYHEVAHGVDDENAFMARNGDKEVFGGWISYGSSVKPIADVVGPHFKFYTTPEQKQYVVDKLLNKPTTAPPVPALPGDWAKAKRDFDNWHTIATAEGVYERQPECDNPLTIGTRIYHEAYPRNWVSYLASARSKGLTGYQFRAPGEWFAELYAGYKSGKLGSKHPALEWLKKL